MLGGAVSLPFASAVLSGCQAAPSVEPFVPQTLAPEQLERVATLAELIIPTTDTPGARAAGVHEFADLLLTEWFDEDDKAAFLSGLDSLDADAQAAHATAFVELDEATQTAMLTTMEEEAWNWLQGVMAGDPALDPEAAPFFHRMKELTLWGYYTSEIGMTQEHTNRHLFSEYEGAVPYDTLGRAWGTNLR